MCCRTCTFEPCIYFSTFYNNNTNTMSDNIQVVVRCRARNEKEVLARSPSILELLDSVFSRDSPYVNVNVNPETNNTSSLSGQFSNPQKSQKRFKLDQVYGPAADQALIFDNVAAPLFTEFLQGSNVTILAYGQTGLGKTHTMCGEMTGDGAGIIPRVLSRLFSSLTSDYMVKMSCVELYKEELKDLIDDDLALLPVRTKLRLVPDSSREVATPKIQNLCELPLDNAEMALKIVEKCLGKRRVGATKLNDQSSRSHTILSLVLYKEDSSSASNSRFRVSRMNLVDLAGSEDINKSGAVNERAREAGFINQSLLALGKVINCLSEGKDPKHVPYRESKLTRLLQGLLGGKTKTALIATVSPAKINALETLSTLNYASKAKNIKNLPQSIHDSDAMLKRVLVSDLAAQIARLTRDIMATKDKEESIKISHQNYLEYTSNVSNLQAHLDEKSTHLLSLEATLESKNLEIIALQLKVGAIEKNLKDFSADLANKDKEIMRLNQRFFKLQEKYLQQNQKMGRIMENNISGVNETLKDAIAHVTSDRSRISSTLESSKRKLIDNLISSQSKLAQGIEELQNLLNIRTYMDSIFEQQFDTTSLLEEVQNFDVNIEKHRLVGAHQALRDNVAQALNPNAHQGIVENLVRKTQEETTLAKQRLLTELTNTVETMFGVHQGKFEQALDLVASSILGNAENLVVEQFDGLKSETSNVMASVSEKASALKRTAQNLEERFTTSKNVTKDKIAATVEQQLNRGVTVLTGTALLETDGAEQGILLSFEAISKQFNQSGLVLEKKIGSVSTDLSNFSEVLATLAPGTSSPDKPLMLANKSVNTLNSPKAKKRKFSPIHQNETLQQSRIPQLSPVRKA